MYKIYAYMYLTCICKYTEGDAREERGEGTPVAAPPQPEGLALHRARLM